MFDLDHFKSINDTYGHDVGDQVICGFSELVRSSLRGIDLFGRWGGEEFIAALPHNDIRAAQTTAERIRKAVATHRFEVAGIDPFSVTVSIGATEFGNGGTSHQHMIKFADNALYEAKNAGRNQVLVWNAAACISKVAS